MDQQQRLTVLSSCWVFAGISSADLEMLAAAATLRRYRRGQIIFAEGDTSDALLVVLEGQLKAVSTSPHGEELLLTVVGPESTLGELALADGGARSATVMAVTEAVVLSLPRDRVHAVAMTSPELMTALLTSIAAVVRRLTGTAADLVFLDLPRRVAKLLLTEMETTGSATLDIGLTQQEMAQQVGASRQSFNAALQHFHRRGWTTATGRRIDVVNAPALRNFVGE